MASASTPIVRAADARTGSGPTRTARETRSSARSIACARSAADSVAEPEVDHNGPPSVTRTLAARSERCARRAVCRRLDLLPHAVEQVGVDLLGRQRVESGARRRTRRRAPSSRRRGRRATRSSGQRHVRSLRHEQEQRLVFDVLLERHRRPVVVRSSEERSAVAAVQEVGVAAVARVDLDERAGAAVERDGVELGATAVGPLERQIVDRRVHRCEARRRPRRDRAAVRCTRAPTRTAAPTVTPAATASSSSGTPAVPATANTTREDEQAQVGAPAPRAAPTRASPRSRPRRHRRRRRRDGKSRRCHPGAVGRPRQARDHRRRRAASSSDEQRGTGARREHDHAEPAPSLPGHDADHHQDRERRWRRSGSSASRSSRAASGTAVAARPEIRCSPPGWSPSPARRTARGAGGPTPHSTRRTTSPGWRK